MTRLTKYLSRFLAILIVVSAISQTTSAPQPTGRLVILRAPNFGWNLALHLQIDGRSVANVVQGRRYDHPISAGHHVLTVTAVPNLNFVDPTSTALNVQPGQMYSFMAMWDDPNHVVLQPTLLSPSQLAQYPP
jgi:hypothetical protein